MFSVVASKMGKIIHFIYLSLLTKHTFLTMLFKSFDLCILLLKHACLYVLKYCKYTSNRH